MSQGEGFHMKSKDGRIRREILRRTPKRYENPHCGRGLGVKFEVQLKEIVRIKMGWKHYQTHPKESPRLVGECLV